MFQILFCTNSGVVRIIALIKIFLSIIRFVVPIGLIVMIIIDLYKNMITGGDEKQSIIKLSGNRILACIIVFCVPLVVNIIMNLIKMTGVTDNKFEADFATCYTEASIELANKLADEKQKKLSEEEEVIRKENLTKAAKYQAEEQARIEKQKELNDKLNNSSGNSEYTSNLNDLNKQNKVYVKNGTFYYPSYQSGKEDSYSGKECPSKPLDEGYNNKYGYNNHFWTMLDGLLKAAKAAGYKVEPSTEGCRHYKIQYNFYYVKYANQPGRAAKPGKSLHGWGIASDLKFYKTESTQCVSSSSRTRKNCPSMAWVHDNAAKYGLEFPLNTDNAKVKEDWHIQPIKLEKYKIDAIESER